MSVKVELRYQFSFYREQMKLPALPRTGDAIEATSLAIEKIRAVEEGCWLKVERVLFVPGYDHVILHLETVR